MKCEGFYREESDSLERGLGRGMWGEEEVVKGRGLWGVTENSRAP